MRSWHMHRKSQYHSKQNKQCKDAKHTAAAQKLPSCYRASLILETKLFICFDLPRFDIVEELQMVRKSRKLTGQASACANPDQLHDLPWHCIKVLCALCARVTSINYCSSSQFLHPQISSVTSDVSAHKALLLRFKPEVGTSWEYEAT